VRVKYYGAGSDCINVSGLPSGVVFSFLGVHTFSEPVYARRWYPCHDVPWDRATVSIEVPPLSGWVASASGIPADSVVIGSRTYARWITPEPIATYLSAFYLGNYVTLTDTTSRGSAEYFTYPGLEDVTRVDFANVPDMLEFYSSIYPYPNPRYAMSLGYFPGGMEHQMNSLISRFIIHGDRSSEGLFAHELAHQWWGNLVTMDSWRHLWLNEGFATCFDLLYTEHRYGRDEMRARIAYTDSVYKSLPDSLDHPILDQPLVKLFSFTLYEKGARVLDMLRAISRMRLMTGPPSAPETFAEEIAAGDARFFSIFAEYAARHAWGNATTDDFQAVAEGALGEDLDWFFTPWLEGTAFPTWETDWNATPHVDGTSRKCRFARKQPMRLGS
jgi:aminopeptidase N